MIKSSTRGISKPNQSTKKEFEFASKEGLIIVSLILFGIYALWYKIFEYYYFGKFITWIIIFWALSIIIFITMFILLITGIYVFWKDRNYILIHEKYGASTFLIGALILLSIPLSWTAGVIEYQSTLGGTSSIFIILGVALCILGSLMLARTGGFFSVWMIGVTIYLIMSFHEGFYIWVWTGFFGKYDDFVGTIGVYVVMTSFILFLYHDLKFFYLTRIIKKGNKYRKERNYKAAIKCFNKAIKIYPLFTTAWNNMGNVYFNQGKPAEAIKCYKKALSFNPAYLNAKKNLDVVSKRLNKV